jgi:hypothetical protein
VETSASKPLTTYHLSPDRDNPAVIQPDIAMSSHLSFQKRCRIIESIAEFFGWRQMTECFPAPKERRKWFKKVKILIVKEVVLSIFNHTPRSQWSFGPATKLFLDLDRVMRPAKMHHKSIKIHRPVAKPCPLEPNPERRRCVRFRTQGRRCSESEPDEASPAATTIVPFGA